jgi:hypothetical protein
VINHDHLQKRYGMNGAFVPPHALCKFAAWGLGKGKPIKLSEWPNGVVILNI